MSSREQDRIRLRLEAERERVRKGARTGQPFDNEQSADLVDQAQSLAATEVTISVLNSEHEKRIAIDNALESLERGEYGICEDCGELIGEKRLSAAPWAARCVACQNERDQDTRQNGSPAYPLAS